MGSFIDQAPCRDSDPWLFDQSQIDLAQPALAYCRACPFWESCEILVEPRSSYFDGVCGGKVWRNGKILARLDASFPHRLEVLGARQDEETMAVRGSELLGDRDGLFLSRESGQDGRESDSGENL